MLQLTLANAAHDPCPVTGIGLSDSTASGSPPAPMSLLYDSARTLGMKNGGVFCGKLMSVKLLQGYCKAKRCLMGVS